MATSPLFGWEEPDDTDLVKDGAAAIRTLGNAIDTSMGDLLGGTSGQVLSKNSNTNMDFTWVTSDDANAIQNTIVDAKGDLIAASAADTPARLAVGANDTVLTADSSTATGLKWAVPASGSTFVGALASTRATQTLSNNTMTAINLATEIYDTNGFHDNVTNNTRFTIPSGKGGTYLFFATGGTDYYTGGLGIRFAKNGTNFSSAYFGFGAPAGGLFVGGLTTVMSLTAGDYVELVLIQNSGSNKAVAYSGTEDFTFMGCTYLGA